MQMYANPTAAVTHHLTYNPKDWQVNASIKRGSSVLSLDWLMEIAASNKFSQPKPRHYIFLSVPDRHQNPNMDNLGDLYASATSLC